MNGIFGNWARNRKDRKNNATQQRVLKLEPLESRLLLTTTQGIEATELNAIKAEYAGFDYADIEAENVFVVSSVSRTNLLNAITDAKNSAGADLIVIRTTDTSNSISINTSNGGFSVNDSSSLIIIARGTKALTIDANQNDNIFDISSSGSKLSLGNMILTDGKSGNGGAIYNKGTLLLDRVHISQNTATELGGGIYSIGTLTAVNSVISGNTSAGHGGGLYIAGTGTNNVVLHNFMTNVTITGNTAGYGDGKTGKGGGIYLNCGVTEADLKAATTASPLTPFTDLTMKNSIIADNKSSATLNDLGMDIYDSIFAQISLADDSALPSFVDGYYNLSSFYCWTTSYDGKGFDPSSEKIGTNLLYKEATPLFVQRYNFTDKIEGDYTLQKSDISQAIDQGDNIAYIYKEDNTVDKTITLDCYENGKRIVYDMTGGRRVRGESVDLGAYESQSGGTVEYSLVVTSLEDTINTDDNKWTLREALYFAPSDGLTITFDESLRGGLISLVEELVIDTALTIEASGMNISISGQDVSRIFNIKKESALNGEQPVVRLSGLTLIDGNSKNPFSTSTDILNGGAIYNEGILSLASCSILDSKTEGIGGAIYNTGTLDVFNSLIAGNSAEQNGGGIWNNGTLTLTNCTVADNSAGTTYKGGGLFNDSTEVATVNNSIIVENNAGAGEKDLSGLVIGTNNLSSYTATDWIAYDDSKTLFESDSYRILSDSQAVDKGYNSKAQEYNLSVDLGGRARYINGTVDLGAYEALKESYKLNVLSGCSELVSGNELLNTNYSSSALWQWDFTGTGENYSEESEQFWLSPDELNLDVGEHLVRLRVSTDNGKIWDEHTVALTVAPSNFEIYTGEIVSQLNGQLVSLTISVRGSGNTNIQKWQIFWGGSESYDKYEGSSISISTAHYYATAVPETYTISVTVTQLGRTYTFQVAQHTVTGQAASAAAELTVPSETEVPYVEVEKTANASLPKEKSGSEIYWDMDAKNSIESFTVANSQSMDLSEGSYALRDIDLRQNQIPTPAFDLDEFDFLDEKMLGHLTEKNDSQQNEDSTLLEEDLLAVIL